MKINIDYEKKIQESIYKSRGAYDMAIGCLNRICVTDNEEEINRMVCGLVHNIEEISNANRRKIRYRKYLKESGEPNESNRFIK